MIGLRLRRFVMALKRIWDVLKNLIISADAKRYDDW